MTKDNDKGEKDANTAGRAAAAIGSAAIAAALLYAGRRFMKKPQDKAVPPGDVPSGEPPQTD
ncbi:MAG: isopropylmalate isomerase [Erythrobacter sp.]|nr:isopropylmalate isomerase [Erythrobacter sp.]